MDRAPISSSLCLVSALLGGGLLLGTQSAAIRPLQAQVNQEGIMQHAKGQFDVTVAPQKPDNAPAEAAKISRMSIDKQFHGDLEGTSKGEMLAAMSDIKGSAGYVAMERVTGKLSGRTGSFVLQHHATMNRGVPALSVTVVPDSGTGELTAITGSMNINVTEGRHSYEFDYTLPAHP